MYLITRLSEKPQLNEAEARPDGFQGLGKDRFFLFAPSHFFDDQIVLLPIAFVAIVRAGPTIDEFLGFSVSIWCPSFQQAIRCPVEPDMCDTMELVAHRAEHVCKVLGNV